MESASKVKALLKEKSWELSRAQAKIAQLEGDVIISDQQFLQLERAKQRETSCREECERRAAELEAAFKNYHEVQKLEQQQQQSCRRAVSSRVQRARASSEGHPSSLRRCPRLHSEATCTSLGASSQIGMSSSRTRSPVVQKGASMPLCNRGSVGSECTSPGVATTRAPVKKTAPNKVLPLHCPATSPAPVTMANRRCHAFESRLVDCKHSQDCQRHQWEALSTASSRRPRRWSPPMSVW